MKSNAGWAPLGAVCVSCLLLACGEPKPVDDKPELELSPTPKLLRVASFNVHRFFDRVCDSGDCGPSSYEAMPSLEAFEADAKRIAIAMAELDVDVVIAQEIESQDCMDALCRHLGPNYPFSVLGEIHSDASVDVAVFAERPIIESRTHRDEVLTLADGTSSRFGREFLEVRLALDEEARAAGRVDLIVFAAHFVSQASDPGPRRLAEAAKACEIVQRVRAEFPEAALLMGGDLNDSPGRPPIDTLDACEGWVRAGADRELADVATYRYDGELSQLDHLYVASPATARYVAGSAEAVRSLPDFGYGGSDHAALRAEIELLD